MIAVADRTAERDDHRREEVESLRHDPDAEQVEHGVQGGLAPYAKHQGADRVDGVYIVRLHKGADPAAVVARLGVGTRHIFGRLPGFSAELTDTELDSLRRDPDVEFVEDNVRGTTVWAA